MFLIASFAWTLVSVVGVVYYDDPWAIAERKAGSGQDVNYDELFEHSRVLKTVWAISAGSGGAAMTTCSIVWALRRQDNQVRLAKRGFDVVIRSNRSS